MPTIDRITDAKPVASQRDTDAKSTGPPWPARSPASARFRDFAVLVVDDASTDETVSWLRASRHAGYPWSSWRDVHPPLAASERQREQS